MAQSSRDRLTTLERFHYELVKKSFDGPYDSALRWCQRTIGATWINYFTENLRHVHGLHRLPELDAGKSYLCVSNHRSFFDLYVITAFLVGRRGMRHRLLFPVRSGFFYDNPLWIFVNGVMSFFAMYPPVFRERHRQALNVASLDEVARVLKRGGAFVGIHPEGTRKKDGDAYSFLPAQSGVGRVIHQARVDVLPVFINGLLNDLPKQLVSNVARSGA